MAEPDLNTYLTTIPNTLSELGKSHNNINQIANYCKSAYATDPDPNAIFLKTQGYIKDALANVAYHIQNVGQHLNNFLLLQTKEINKIDLQIQTITDRLRIAKESTGAVAFRTQDSVKPYQKRPKVAKVDDRELPASSRPQNKFVRAAVNLRLLDNCGIDLQGNRGNEPYKTIGEGGMGYESSPGHSDRSSTIRGAPPIISAPSFAPYNNPPPLSAPAFPPPMASMPPPPMMNSMPPPPPSSDFGLPPPPPPSFEYELPPPPPPL